MIAALVLLLAGDATCGEEYRAPFVAGFDGFARHDQVDEALGGRLLLSELSCTACHKTANRNLQPKLGPRLDGAADRIQWDWLRRFLVSPHSAKPGTTMPDVLAGMPAGDRQHAVDALVAFLSTQHAAFPQLKASGANPLPHEFWRKGNVARGRKLYHQIGCVACHEPDQEYEMGQPNVSQLDRLLKQLGADEIEEMGLAGLAHPVRSVPHGDLAAKYTSRSLTFFLLNPARARPSGRMPNFDLQPVDAADVAAYLLRNREGAAAVKYPGANQPLIQEGRRLFSEIGCANCHAVNGLKPARKAKSLADLRPDAAKACIRAAQPEIPHYALDPQQTKAVQAALRGLQAASSAVATAEEQVEFQMLQLNCFACHKRGEFGGVGRNRRPYFATVGHIDLGDEGRLPPPLTQVGRKLRGSWLQKVLAGTGHVRPYMLARMPIYPKQAVAELPELFVEADASGRPSNEDVFGDLDGLGTAGRMLLDVGCVQCHPIRGESLPGVAGVDLGEAASRLQPAWFREFLLDPGQLKRGTRMPTFFPGGKSSNQELLGGDVEKQIAAMWVYLKGIDKHPLPPKLVAARSKQFELVPRDRPILLRTFMKQAGTHAIAVGFPEKVHFAFDAEQVRLAQAWRSRFLDAYGTWFVRFAPPAEPLGKDVKNLPAGPPLAILKDDQQPWPAGSPQDAAIQFRGYRIDRAGVPTFLYRWNGFDIEDRIEPSPAEGLSRRIRIVSRDKSKQKNTTVWFRANVGNSLRQEKADSYTNDNGLTSVVSEHSARLGILRDFDEQVEWIIPVAIEGEAVIEVEYQW